MQNNFHDISSILKFHRKRSGLTQSRLAELAGTGKTVVFDLEKGKQTIQLDTLLKILKALNITARFESPIMEQYLKTKEVSR